MSDSIVHGRLTVRTSSDLARVVIEALEGPNLPSHPLATSCDNDAGDDKGRIHEKAVQREVELAKQDFEEELARWSEQIPVQLNQYFEELESRVRAEVVDLSLQLARMILGADVPRQLAVQAALDEALTHVMRECAVQIRLHPEDANRMTEIDRAHWPAEATCEPDPSLNPGDVVAYTEHGLLDATLKGRMEMLEETIREVLSVEEEENGRHSPATD